MKTSTSIITTMSMRITSIIMTMTIMMSMDITTTITTTITKAARWRNTASEHSYIIAVSHSTCHSSMSS